MKRYLPRLTVAILTFSIGVLTVSFDPCHVRMVFPSRVFHSLENKSPYSALEGHTVRLKPYDATFEIPEPWLTRSHGPEPPKNLYLTYQDLNELCRNAGADEEEAQVINAILPLEDAAVHFGAKAGEIIYGMICRAESM